MQTIYEQLPLNWSNGHFKARYQTLWPSPSDLLLFLIKLVITIRPVTAESAPEVIFDSFLSFTLAISNCGQPHSKPRPILLVHALPSHLDNCFSSGLVPSFIFLNSILYTATEKTVFKHRSSHMISLLKSFQWLLSWPTEPYYLACASFLPHLSDFWTLHFSHSELLLGP